jgi:uncharacterized protein YgbK (DUF1537 family)
MAMWFGVVADDLTGGLIIASLLEREGFSCPLVTSPQIVPTLDKAEAIVVARRTRLIRAAEAVIDFDRAATALMDARVFQIYYKYCATFDSNDDGNIGPCSDSFHMICWQRAWRPVSAKLKPKPARTSAIL